VMLARSLEGLRVIKKSSFTVGAAVATPDGPAYSVEFEKLFWSEAVKLHSARVCLACMFLWDSLHDGFCGYYGFDLGGPGDGVFDHPPYVREIVPREPLLVDAIPEALLAQMYCAWFPALCFGETEHLQPLEHLACSGYLLDVGQTFLCGDLRTIGFLGGVERLRSWSDRRQIDQRGDYGLFVMDLGDGIPRHYLRMLNPSTGVWHVEGVHPDCRTVAEALAWRNQADVPPEILT
jgi:hypothetical protein